MRSIYKFLKGLVAWCHSFVYLWNVTVHTVHSFYNIYAVNSSVAICWGSSPFRHRWPAHRVSSRESNSGLPYIKPTHYQLSYAAPYWATPHPTELHRPCGPTPHPTELRRTLRATPHPLSYASPNWAMRHLTKLRRSLLSYAAPYWASPNPSRSSLGKTSLGCRAENRTRACLTSSRRTNNWLRRTLLR